MWIIFLISQNGMISKQKVYQQKMCINLKESYKVDNKPQTKKKSRQLLNNNYALKKIMPLKRVVQMEHNISQFQPSKYLKLILLN